ncbi:MAG TPA: phosphoribosylanthranilate isomerase [Kofleriaceae bacterium]
MTAPRIKICGVTLPDDAARVAAAGADFIGLNFWPRSKRYVTLERAPLLAAAARAAGAVKLVGVFVDATIEQITAACGRVELDVIQLHGDERADTCTKLGSTLYRPIWKALPIGHSRDLEGLDYWQVDALLLDAPAARVRHARPDISTELAARVRHARPDLGTELAAGRGGAGARFDHQLARAARERYPTRKFVLAGGLDPGNVAEAIALVQPWAVDVASGVEAAPGIKDAGKLAAFVAAVRGAAP